VRISISVTNYSWPGDPRRVRAELADLAGTADRAGVDTVWVTDHLIQADPTAPPADADMLEAYTVLGYLAARTEHIRLGAMVSPVAMREPALLVKAVTTLDVVSDGRAWLGIGAGYNSDEAHAMGLSLPPTPERFERLEETLQIAQQMWAGDEAPFTGRHYRLARPHGTPRPVQQPHPPILIGGAGEQRTLRHVARYADACNLFDIPDGGRTIRHKLDVLAGHCAEAGRRYEDIEKTVSTRLVPDESPDSFARRCNDLEALGIEHAVVLTSQPWDAESLAILSAAARQA
jgi:F420-dependent oxidoreductase-like protein